MSLPRVVVALALTLAAGAREPAWSACYLTWNCGASSQCAQAYGSPAGQRGPFDSCAGAPHDGVSRCACGGSAPASPGPTAAPAAGLAPSQQLGLQMGMLGAQMIGQGLRQLMTPRPSAGASSPAPSLPPELRQSPNIAEDSVPSDPCQKAWTAAADSLANQADAMNDEHLEAQDFPRAGVRGLGDYYSNTAAGALGDGLIADLRGPGRSLDDPPVFEPVRLDPNPRVDIGTAKADCFEDVCNLIGRIGDEENRMIDFTPKKENLLEYAWGSLGDAAKTAKPSMVVKNGRQAADWTQNHASREGLEAYQKALLSAAACRRFTDPDKFDECLGAVNKAIQKTLAQVFRDSFNLTRAQQLAKEARDAMAKYAESALNKAEGLMAQAGQALARCP